jgi:hypothetical protein
MKLRQILNEDSIQKGDTVIYKYSRTTNHALGGSDDVIALVVKDIEKKGMGWFAEVFLDGRFQNIHFKYLKKTKKKYKDGQVISSKAHYSGDKLKFLKRSLGT